MHFSAEILDRIFSFLVSHRETLIACSKDPVLYPIVERHLYSQITAYIGGKVTDEGFPANELSELLFENPRIARYVRILEIQVESDDLLDEFAKTLLTFPLLECVTLTTYQQHLPKIFRAALEDRLRLPTLKEVHVTGSDMNPLSLLNKCKNLKHLSLSLEFPAIERHEDRSLASALPQLHSLNLLGPYAPKFLLPWAELHINELRSLKCGLETLLELLEVCSGTLNLNELDITLEDNSYYTEYTFQPGDMIPNPFPDLQFPVPPNLQKLTIRTAVDLEHKEPTARPCRSWIPAAVEIINIFISPPCHLVLDINIKLDTFSDLPKVDFSPLAILGPASSSIPHIDLYVHTSLSPTDLAHAQLLSLLEDIVWPIKEGVLVIHLETTAPDVWLVQRFRRLCFSVRHPNPKKSLHHGSKVEVCV